MKRREERGCGEGAAILNEGSYFSELELCSYEKYINQYGLGYAAVTKPPNIIHLKQCRFMSLRFHISIFT